MAEKFLKYLQSEGSEDKYYMLPIVTDNHSGMIMKVINGEWAVTDLIPIPGVRSADGTLITWDDLVTNGLITLSEDGTSITDSDTSLVGDFIIPDSVTSISDNAFYQCTGLTSVIIPEGVTTIGSDAFRGCTGLTYVVIPNSVTSISNSAFRGCTGLTSITIPDRDRKSVV